MSQTEKILEKAYSVFCRLALVLFIFTTLISAGIFPDEYAFYSAKKAIDFREGYEKTYILNNFIIIYLLMFEILYFNREKISARNKTLIKGVNFILMLIAIYQWGILGGSSLMYWTLFSYHTMFSAGPNKSLKDAP